MHASVTIFKKELLNCINDLIDIMKDDFAGDSSASKLSSELMVAKNLVVPLGEHGMVEFMNSFLNGVIHCRDKIQARDKAFFERIIICKFCVESEDSDCICKTKCGELCECETSCIYCSDVLTSMDSKTFNAIKMVMKKGQQDVVDMCFDYIDCFIAACEKYRMETKEKLN